MIKKLEIPPILDEEGSARFLDNIMKLWIKPELKKRLQYEESIIIPNKILIKMPLKKPAIVEFGKEIKLFALAKNKAETPIKKGDLVYTTQNIEFLTVAHPKVNNIPVNFIFLHYHEVDKNWHIFLDSTVKELDLEEYDLNWQMGKNIATSLQSDIEEHFIMIASDTSELLDHGIWPAPSLIPYPMGKILELLLEQNAKEVDKILKEHANVNFLREMVIKWFNNHIFKNREKIFQQILKIHEQEMYVPTIVTLTAQIEGIITDYLYSQTPKKKISNSIQEKIKEFKNITMSKHKSKTEKLLISNTTEFILIKQLAHFNWVEKIYDVFPNRHENMHGKYGGDSLYTKLNSIKLFLLLDTLHYIISIK